MSLNFQSMYFATRREVPKDTVAKSHELLLRGGFIHQELAGVFTFLPLGLRVLRQIEKIVREEINAIGGEEILMPALEPKANWLKTDRWDNFDALFKVKSRWGATEYALGPTHEEVVIPLVKEYIHSYRDLPRAVYQIQTKFRDEPRAKSGVIRGREFGMKDLYSFHATKEELSEYYETIKKAYLKIFQRCGIKAKVTEASGGSFTKKFSHEFMAISPAGEDDIIACTQCSYAQNKEIATLTEKDKCPICRAKLAWEKAIEVGNIFDLGTKFSEDFGLYYLDKNGKKQTVVIGCYGIGTTRLVGAIAELHHDENGINWPKEVAPFDVEIVGLNMENKTVRKQAQEAQKILAEQGLEALVDGREEMMAGAKFKDADLIGIPVGIIVSNKTAESGKVEIKKRGEKTVEMVAINKIKI